MLLFDRLFLAVFWLRWRAARFHWSLLERMNRRADFPPHVRRRLVRFEFQAWRHCSTAAARLEREERRLRQVR